jgi:hypothetical protein
VGVIHLDRHFGGGSARTNYRGTPPHKLLARRERGGDGLGLLLNGLEI